MAAVLQATGIVKRFGSLAALDGVDLSLESGEILGVIGPNGSGKSTLFKVLSGILKPDAGRVRLLGSDITGRPDWRICRLGLALTGQVASPLAEMTVLENAVVAATFGGGKRNRGAKRLALEMLELVGLQDQSMLMAGDLTLVQRRSLELARALATEPKVLLLDENLAGLTTAEIEQSLELIRTINQQGVSMIMVEHVMQAVIGVCSRIIVLDYGKIIAQGPAGDVVRAPEVIEAYLGDRYA